MAQLASSRMLHVLLACGAASTALYVTSDVVGALSYPGYDYAGQAISEMSAIGAPTTHLLAPFYRAFSLLFVAFAAGVWLSGGRDLRLRWSAGFMVAVAALGAGLSVFPMNMRGVDRSASDTLHLVCAAATMLFLSGAILCGGAALDRGFRRYSIATVLTMLLFFGFTMLDAPNVAANRPTPLMGINERVSMAAWLLWIAIFSMKLARSSDRLATAATARRRSRQPLGPVIAAAGAKISTRVADAAAQPLSQAGLVIFCAAWWVSGLPTDVLTATLSIVAITLTQMVLNRQKSRDEDDRRRDVAMHAKLDELLRAEKYARKELAGIEELETEEIAALKLRLSTTKEVEQMVKASR